VLPFYNASFHAVDVLHRDKHVLAVNKPPGVLAQPDHTGDPDVLSRAKRLLGGTDSDPFLGLVHRLDRPASGVMVLARTSEAAAHLSRQFRERTAEKRYLVLVEGRLRGLGTWTDYIAKPGRRPRLVPPEHPDGKRAVLDWQALATADARTLLQIILRTGRPHQIRLQATSRGHPVMGDERYGAEASLGKRALALHHSLLRLDHPAHPRRNTFTSAPPPAWASALTDEMHSAIRRVLDQAHPSAPSSS
jgi:tRNA pseudouridine32 synthase/23S rRNA pseudouridine746 synthase/23S rRNA pseudouridine1911/1915/1917 synthase